MAARNFDVVIAGGAAVGSAVAYFLKRELGFSGSVAVIERDATFRTASTSLSAASIRVQFSTPENIRMSRFGLQFLRQLQKRKGPGFDPAFVERGYLILSPPSGKSILEENRRAQEGEGARVAVLDRAAIAARFPWLSLDGIAAGSLGLAEEGWFDANTLLRALREGAREAGTTMVDAEIVAIDRAGGRVAAVRLPDGERIGCGILVNATGPSGGRFAALAGRPLPVEPRKRTVFVLDCPTAPHDFPLVCDPAGFWVRPEGSGFLTGFSPGEEADPTADPADFDPDHHIFEDILWPELAARIPAFETLKVTGAWAGHYDHNTFDQNAIIGPDPELPNFIYANGFSGHGLQQSPATGRAVAELIATGRFQSLDLSAFGYDRIAAGRPVIERNVI